MPPSPPLLFSNSQRKLFTKQTGLYQSGTLNMFIYRSSRSSVRGLKDSRLLVFRLWDLVPRCGVGGRAPVAMFDGCRKSLTGLQRVTWSLQMCDCSQGPNLFRGGGDLIRIFFIQPHRDTAFSKRPAVIQCLSEIKASPHSCLMLTGSWKNWLGVDLGGSFPTLLLYLFHWFLSLQPHTSFQTLELGLLHPQISFIIVMIRSPHGSASKHCELHCRASVIFPNFLRHTL